MDKIICKQCNGSSIRGYHLRSITSEIHLICGKCGAKMEIENVPPPPPPPQTKPGYMLSGRDGDLDLLPLVVLMGGAFTVVSICFVLNLNPEHGLLGYFAAASFYYTFRTIRVKR